MIYLCSPYSHGEDYVLHSRYEAAVAAVAHLTRKGQLVYSPIVHYHNVAFRHQLPKEFDFWQKMNYGMIDHADSLIVLKVAGWDESKGIQGEVKYAQDLGLHITFMEPVDG